MTSDAASFPEPGVRDYLFGLALHGVKLGLRNIRQLLNAADNPQDRYPTVHIAGTNGKGSVAALLKAMFQAAGYRPGVFTSPHLIDVCERFQVAGRPIGSEVLDETTTFFRNVARDMPQQPTFFEMNTAIAFEWFAQEKVDVGLIEVGMGGRLDSTNVITPEAAAFTNIDLEHTQYLGDTLEAIAAEKAGVLKAGIKHAIVGEMRPGPRDVILARAKALGVNVATLGNDFTYTVEGDPWSQRFSYRGPVLELSSVPLGLPGRYQGANAAVAVAMAEALFNRFPCLNNSAVTVGLAEARWPCRLERVVDEPVVIIDVAHNVAGTRKLAESLRNCITVLAIASDKDARGMLDVLGPISDTLILSTFSGKRTLPLSVLQDAAGTWPHRAITDLGDAIREGLALTTIEKPLLITGSIYTAGEGRQILIEHLGADPPRF